ncbi:nucleotide cyclase [Chytriomyces cf. hyalinus JEL632]|nr:nucleotide cyclase [Chytriomyces cf. hyalinus JEL632]
MNSLQKPEVNVEKAPLMTFVWINFGMWAVGVYYTVSQRLFGGHRVKAFDRGDADFYYKGHSFVFLVATAFAYLGYIGTKNVVKKSMIWIMLMTNSVVSASWFLLYLRAGVTFMDNSGNPVDTIRHLEWFHDQSNLVYVACLLTSTDYWSSGRAIASSHMTFVFGFLACLARHPYDELFATLSMVSHLVLMQEVIKMYQRAIDGEVENKVDLWTLKRSRDVIVFSYAYITVAWYLVRTHIIRFDTGELHIAIGEFIAKIVFMLVIVNNSMEESQISAVREMDSITSSMDEQMAASDKLLEKMIPPAVLEQLKSGRATGAEEYASVTIFFSDIANFTPLSQRTSTKDMLASLNNMWVEYDAISKKHGMYKVETIGDAFLGVVGAPDRVPDHAERAASFSLDIIEMIRGFRLVTGEPIQIRAGLCSGPVTAGILGETNPHWCVVGDTVSIASKMEATSKHMKIHIAESTYNLVKGSGKFVTSQGEPVSIKGTTHNTFFIESRV